MPYRQHLIPILLLIQFLVFISPVAAQDCIIEAVQNVNIRPNVIANLEFVDLGDRLIDIQMVSFTSFDKQSKIATYREQVSSRLPKNECGSNVSLLNTSERISGNSWHLKSSVRTRKYICLKTKGFCCRGLKCRSCEWKWIDENLGFRKTLDLDTWLTPVIHENGESEYTISVNAYSKLEQLQQWEKDLLNLLKNIAGVLQIVSINLIDIKDFFDGSLPNLPSLTIYKEQFKGVENFRPIPTRAEFSYSPHGFGVQVSANQVRSCAVAKEVQRYFKSLDQIKYQISDAEEQYVVKANDTAWGIAKKFYGDGRYYTFISEHNAIKKIDDLSVGDLISLPTIGKMSKKYKYMIGIGDTVWGKTADAKDREILSKHIISLGRDPNLIFPLEGFIER